MQLILANAVSIVCIICAAVLAAMEKGGWGWFLVIGVILYVGPTAYSYINKDDGST